MAGLLTALWGVATRLRHRWLEEERLRLPLADLPTALEGLPETAELEDIYYKFIDGPRDSAAATKLAHDLAHFGPRCKDFWSEMVGSDIAENSRDAFGFMTPERMGFLDPERTVDTESLTRISDMFKPAEPRAAQPPATAGGAVSKRKGGAAKRKGKKDKGDKGKGPQGPQGGEGA